MKRLWSILTAKQTSVSSAAFILISMVFTSRILGLVRDRLLSARFDPDELGVYFAAFRVPNLLFELLVTGALTSAFIPVFTKFVSDKRENDAWNMSSTLISMSVIVLICIALPMLIWTETLSFYLAPGFSAEQLSQMAWFTRIMIVFQVLPLLIGNFFTGILQSYNFFFIPALAPVIYNIGIIGCILFLTSGFGLFAPVIGIGVGAFLFMVVQAPFLLQLGYRYRLRLRLKDPGVSEVGKLMAPRTFGLAVSQIDTTVDQILATLLGARMVTIFSFAQHLQQLPIGLFGTTIAQAALPALARFAVGRQDDQFKSTIQRAIHQVFFFVLPISALFIVLRIPVVRLVFGASRFDWQATVLTGMTLSAFSISLFAQAMVQILTRGFYALYDTKTPVVVGVISIIVNTVLSIVFITVFHWPVWALGISTSIASIFHAFVLVGLISTRVPKFLTLDFLLPPIKMGIASILMGLALYFPMKLFDQLIFDTTRTFGLILLTGISGGIGLGVYGFLSWVFGINEVHSFFRLLQKVGRYRTVFTEPSKDVQ